MRRLTSLLRIQRLRAERGMPTLETSHHLVFTGNPGTGKTTVARLLSQILRTLGIVSKGHLVETDRSHLVAGYVGQTAERTRKVLESALGGTLLIDEAYALARGSEQDFGREAIDTIVKFMEDHRDDLAVIAAGYPEEMAELIDANPGLSSRFARTIHFPDYTTEELLAIFESMSEANRYHLDEAGALRLAELIDAEPRTRGLRQRPLRAQRVRGGDRPAGRAAGDRRAADRRAADHAHRRRRRRSSTSAAVSADSGVTRIDVTRSTRWLVNSGARCGGPTRSPAGRARCGRSASPRSGGAAAGRRRAAAASARPAGPTW